MQCGRTRLLGLVAALASCASIVDPNDLWDGCIQTQGLAAVAVAAGAALARPDSSLGGYQDERERTQHPATLAVPAGEIHRERRQHHRGHQARHRETVETRHAIDAAVDTCRHRAAFVTAEEVVADELVLRAGHHGRTDG